MSKSRVVLAAVGGVIAALAAVAAVFAYLSYAAKVAAVEGDDENEGLEAAVEKVKKLSRADVYPCSASVKELDEDVGRMADWLMAVRKFVAAGESKVKRHRVYATEMPAAFKTFVMGDARRLCALPGEAPGGGVASREFAFGPFKNYIAGGEMPSEAQLAELQRQWDDISTVFELFSTNGVSEVLDLHLKTAEKKEEPERDDAKSRRNARKQKKGARAQGQDAAPKALSSARSYVFSFTASPSALVRVVNAFATSDRFITVDEFSFQRARDAVAEALAGEDKKAEAQPGGRRRRRAAAQAEQQAAEAQSGAAHTGVVTDPATDAKFTVSMTLTVHDFGSLEKTESSEEGQK